jgi:hypothetical protein
MKTKRNIIAVFLCLAFLIGFVAYKNFWVHPLKNINIKASRVLSGEEYTKIKEELLNEQDPKIALSKLRERVKTDDALLRSCHLLTHDIGHSAYQKYGNFGEAMKFQDEICNSGYLHGIIESYFSQHTPDAETLKAVCGAYPEGKFLAWECYHGVGHGLMFFTQNDLPKSLALCSEFRADFEKSSCINGVFMENFNTDEKLHPSRFLKESDPFYPCGEQADENKAACYLYAPTYYLSMHKNDYIGAIRWCNGAEMFYGGVCANGVGTQVMKENINDVKFVERTCMSAPALKVGSCIEGMTGLYINHYSSILSAQKMCAQLEEENQEFCYNTITSRSALFSL